MTLPSKDKKTVFRQFNKWFLPVLKTILIISFITCLSVFWAVLGEKFDFWLFVKIYFSMLMPMMLFVYMLGLASEYDNYVETNQQDKGV